MLKLIQVEIQTKKMLKTFFLTTIDTNVTKHLK